MGPSTQQAAERIFTVIPRAMTKDLLQEYGLASSEHPAQMITKEVLFLSVFWVVSAIRVSFSNKVGEEIFQHVLQLIREMWGKEFQLEAYEPEGVLKEMGHRHSAYRDITRQGGQPFAVFSDATEILESQGVIRTEDQQKLVGLLLDVVPVDEIGDVVSDLENEWANF